MMRRKYDIKIPDSAEYLSEFPEFDSLLERGKVIVNKEVCGCGATEYYLRLLNLPVVLISPRLMLIETKMDKNPTDEEMRTQVFSSGHRQTMVFYFDRSEADKYSLSYTTAELKKYLTNPKGYPTFVPKIVVTYDSFPYVYEVLKQMQCLELFTVVVDEFSSIFGDVKMKGSQMLNLVRMLSGLNNHIVYISATPLKDQYLDAIPMFQDVTYYNLIWNPSRLQRVLVTTEPMRSTVSKMEEIVTEFRRTGFFRSTLVNGVECHSKEGVFYVNSVIDIVKIINKCRLKSSETLILCSKKEENRLKLKKIDSSLGKFTIGRPASFDEYDKKNKTFTLVTRVCFEGADMYSDSSSTYIFSDANVDSLTIDISIDLKQIAGRCRNYQPFRDNIVLFYKTSDNEMLKKSIEAVQKRMGMTNQMLPHYQNINDVVALAPILDAQKHIKYNNYYLDVEIINPATGEARAIVNELAHQADLRAIDIKKEQYASGYSVCYFVTQNMQQLPSSANDIVIENMFREYSIDKDFIRRMKLYVDTLDKYPTLKADIETRLTMIDLEIKEFYNILGADVIRACGYKRSELLKRVQDIRQMQSCRNPIIQRIYTLLPHGQSFTREYVKDILKQVYAEFGINQNVTAKDIETLIPVQQKKVIGSNGNRLNGYKIL